MAEEVKIEVYDGLDDVYQEADAYQESSVPEEEVREPEAFAGEETTATTSSSSQPTIEAKPPQPITTTEQKQTTTETQVEKKTQTKVVKKPQPKKKVVKRRVPAIKVVPRQRQQGFRIDWTSFFLGMGSAFVIYWSYKKFFKRGKK